MEGMAGMAGIATADSPVVVTRLTWIGEGLALVFFVTETLYSIARIIWLGPRRPP